MECDEIISQVAISLLDEVEEKIQKYDLRLKKRLFLKVTTLNFLKMRSLKHTSYLLKVRY